MLLFLTKTTLLMASLSSGDKGNGGDGFVIEGTPYLYDLVEAGVHKTPYFDHNIKLDPYLQGRIEKIFSHAPDLDLKLVTRKLIEIYNVDKIFGISLLYAMELYSWRWVDLSLYDVPDDGDTVVRYNRDMLIQLAVRYNRAITIDATEWTKLNGGNKVALIFHEVIYALLNPKFIRSEKCIAPSDCQTDIYEQDANLARQITGFLFTGELRKGKAALGKFIKKDLPNSAWFKSEIKNSMKYYNSFKHPKYDVVGVETLGLKDDRFYITPHVKLKIITGERYSIFYNYLWSEGIPIYPKLIENNHNLQEAQDYICSDLSIMSNRSANVGIEAIEFRFAVLFEFNQYTAVDGEEKSYIQFKSDNRSESFSDFGVMINLHVINNTGVRMHLYRKNIQDACEGHKVIKFLQERRDHFLKEAYWLTSSEGENEK